MAAYSLYQENSYQDAINALNRFIQLHPGNRDIAYAYYLRALCYYEQVTDVGRDQSNGEQALSSLEELIRRYPETSFARDARHKIDLVRDQLAGKELMIGRFYETRGQYLAAINRFKVVVNKYQTTSQVPEALHRLVECYMALGIVDEAQQDGRRSRLQLSAQPMVHRQLPAGREREGHRHRQSEAEQRLVHRQDAQLDHAVLVRAIIGASPDPPSSQCPRAGEGISQSGVRAVARLE